MIIRQTANYCSPYKIAVATNVSPGNRSLGHDLKVLGMPLRDGSHRSRDRLLVRGVKRRQLVMGRCGETTGAG